MTAPTQVFSFVGIDPGLVHTGLVYLHFDLPMRQMYVETKVLDGIDVDGAAAWCARRHPTQVYIEAYKPRSHYQNDPEMGSGIAALRKAIPHSQTLLNMGVKKVVTKDLLEFMELWKFSTVTHHQDLRSAARIAVFGMLRDTLFNSILTRMLVDHLAGDAWEIHKGEGLSL